VAKCSVLIKSDEHTCMFVLNMVVEKMNVSFNGHVVLINYISVQNSQPDVDLLVHSVSLWTKVDLTHPTAPILSFCQEVRSLF
jgi:hypothetical protein